MSDPLSRAHAGDALAHAFRNQGSDLVGLLTAAVIGCPEPTEEPATVRELAIDPSQGRGASNRPHFDALEDGLLRALGMR